jgi:hypothetical protein
MEEKDGLDSIPRRVGDSQASWFAHPLPGGRFENGLKRICE